MAELNELDKKLLEHFRGYVVRKDLVRSVKVGANVPVFVLEYLIANSCSTDDEEQIHKGMENVKRCSRNIMSIRGKSLIHARIKEKATTKSSTKFRSSLIPKRISIGQNC